jgi:hypothetical protein
MPIQYRVDDGFGATIVFCNSEISGVDGGKCDIDGSHIEDYLWEKSVTPPGADGGGAHDVTTNANKQWRTQAPGFLKSATDVTFEAAYDPAFIAALINKINMIQQITIFFPLSKAAHERKLNYELTGIGSPVVPDSISMWGWLNAVTPGAMTEGAQPTVTCTIVPSNMNHLKKEAGPVFIRGTGGLTGDEIESSTKDYEGYRCYGCFDLPNQPQGGQIFDGNSPPNYGMSSCPTNVAECFPPPTPGGGGGGGGFFRGFDSRMLSQKRVMAQRRLMMKYISQGMSILDAKIRVGWMDWRYPERRGKFALDIN